MNALKRKRLIILFSLLIVSTFVIYSCYPDYGLTTSDYDTVITLFDKSENFNQPTYAMPDTIIHFVEDGKEDDIDRTYDALILQTIETNMSDLGYQRVVVDTSVNPPAFAVLVGVTTADNYGAVWWPGWGYWPGWGWWGGYPGWGYPGGGAVYNYKTGSIFITMLDPNKHNSGDQTFGAVWLARINGILSQSLDTSRRIKQRIGDAFSQSPYLGVK